MDRRNLKDKEELSRILSELEKTIEEEKQIDEEIEAYLERGEPKKNETILSSLDNLKLVENQVESLCLHTEKIASRIGKGHAISEKVTKRVRQLDYAQSHVKECLQVVDRILDLKNAITGVRGSIKAGNYKSAVYHVSVYHKVVSMITVSVSDQLLMESSITDLKSIVTTNFENALAKKNFDEISKYACLFEPLGITQEGLDIFLKEECDSLKILLNEDQNFSTETLIEKLTDTFNTTASAIQRTHDLVHTSFSQADGSSCLITCLNNVCEETAVTLLKKYIHHRELLKHIRQDKDIPQNNVDKNIESLDTLLNELALIIQHTETYGRFITGKLTESNKSSNNNELSNKSSNNNELSNKSSNNEPSKIPLSATELTNTVQEIAGIYATLENQFLTITAKKALSLDHLDEAQKKSSCIDEIFYFARISGLRGLATGHIDSAAAVLNFVGNVLTMILLEEMHDRLNKMTKYVKDPNQVQQQVQMQLAKLSKNVHQHVQWNMNMSDMLGVAANQRHGEGDPPVDDAKPTPFWPEIVLNNLEASYEYSIKLRQQIEEEVPESFDGVPSKLSNGLAGLSDSSKSIQIALDGGRIRLCEVLHPRLSSFLHSVVKDVHYDLNEDDFNNNQVNSPFIPKIVDTLDRLLHQFQQLLTNTNFSELLQLLLEDLISQLEKVVTKKKFTQLGGIQLDKDIRSLFSYFTAKSKTCVTKERVARINQICLILTLDSPEDVLDYWGKNVKGVAWQFSVTEVKALLRLRMDFRPAAVSKLILS